MQNKHPYELDFEQYIHNGEPAQKEKSYTWSTAIGLQMEETVKHIAFFVSRLWQIHAFGEGNTRTTSVFTIKYFP